MKHIIKVLALAAVSVCFLAFNMQKGQTHKLTIKVSGIRNSAGVVQFTLYNKEGSIPDKGFNKYYKQAKGRIVKGAATVTFPSLPKGYYAVNILHDENNNGQVDKGLILPEEGIGFSNYSAINLTNKPGFTKAKFDLKVDTTVVVKINYF